LKVIILASLLAVSAPFAAAQHEGHDHDHDHGSEQAAAEPLDNKAVSYILGNQFGSTLKNDDIEVDQDELVRGLLEGLAGHSEYTPAQGQQAMRQLQAFVTKKRNEKRQVALTENKQKAEAFLAENKEKEGVVTLDSGLQYKVLTKGEGPQPTADNRVKVHYVGKLIDGSEFDSSHRRGEPAVFGVSGLIKGWTEALQLMKVGSKWQLFVPPELGYAERGSGPKIPGNSALVFEVELLEIVE